MDFQKYNIWVDNYSFSFDKTQFTIHLHLLEVGRGFFEEPHHGVKWVLNNTFQHVSSIPHPPQGSNLSLKMMENNSKVGRHLPAACPPIDCSLPYNCYSMPSTCLLHTLQLPLHALQLPLHVLQLPLHALQLPLQVLQLPLRALQLPLHSLHLSLSTCLLFWG